MNWTTFFKQMGALEAQSKQQLRETGEVKADLRAMKTKLDAVQSFQDRQRGMWAAVAVIAALIGAIAGIIARFIGH